MAKTILINWSEQPGQIQNVDLFKAPDFQNYNIALFDPLNFAFHHNLRNNRRDLSSSEYIKLDKDDLMRLMANFKRVTNQLRSFLDKDGILIIRANIPNSYIQIRSFAAQGTQKYTESVLSAFFWLEEFIGKYSFLYRLCSTLDFVDYNNALYRNFHDAPIAAYQSLDIIPQGEVNVLGRCGAQASSPLLSRVSLKPDRGEIFFIPEFKVQDELTKLISTFEETVYEVKSGLFKPSWVSKFEQEMSINNPYKEELEGISQKIELLTKRKLVLIKRENQIMNTTGLLFKAGEELNNVTRQAFESLGFECLDRPEWLPADKVQFCFKADGKIIGVVQVTDTELGPVPESYFESLSEIEGLEKFDKRPKLILVANADRQQPPNSRSEFFEDSIIESSAQHEYCLMPTTELFNAVSYSWYKSNSELYNTIKTSLRKDIMGCTGEFKVDERKYLVRKSISKPQTMVVR